VSGWDEIWFEDEGEDAVWRMLFGGCCLEDAVWTADAAKMYSERKG
jgi:hypothetical protein